MFPLLLDLGLTQAAKELVDLPDVVVLAVEVAALKQLVAVETTVSLLIRQMPLG
ncbi:MAG: hypothetical protein Q7S31_00575 [bacterium]|nr:hypothetical protein [bacterium]